ncbi:MAG: hypothetical protein J5J06_03810 [Phycisphaerae bacterium]|nr:hypothetical protein [Phycisphaerae bacterium]
MPSVRCSCGAKFRFAEEHRGRRSKCKKCGAIFVLEEEETGPIPIADEPDQPYRDPQYDGPSLDALNLDGPRIEQPSAAAFPREEPSPPLVPPPTPAKGYINNLTWTLLFFTSPTNLITMLVVWFMLGVVLPLVSFGGILGLIAFIFIMGLFAAFEFEVVKSAAAGEDGLPTLAFEGDFVGEVFAPIFKWLASWVAIMLPAIGFVLLKLYLGEPVDEDATGKLFFSGLEQLPSTFKAEPITASLILLGVFFWPIVVLAVAVEGIRVLWRVDLMVITILRSPGPYLVTVIIVVVSFIAAPALAQGIESAAVATGATPGFGQRLFSGAVIQLVDLYLTLVALQVIGLYFRHYKHRFAFDWGQ